MTPLQERFTKTNHEIETFLRIGASFCGEMGEKKIILVIDPDLDLIGDVRTKLNGYAHKLSVVTVRNVNDALQFISNNKKSISAVASSTNFDMPSEYTSIPVVILKEKPKSKNQLLELAAGAI